VAACELSNRANAVARASRRRNALALSLSSSRFGQTSAVIAANNTTRHRANLRDFRRASMPDRAWHVEKQTSGRTPVCALDGFRDRIDDFRYDGVAQCAKQVVSNDTAL